MRVIFLPGNGGSTTQDNWFPYLKSHLTAAGIEVIDATFPDPELGRKSHWFPFLKEDIGIDNQTVLIGHSTGAIAALCLAAEQPILGSVLVGAYHTDLGMETEKKSGYFDHPWDWQKIQENQAWTLLFASQDDPWIPVEEPRYIHQQLDCEYHEYTDQGHFGGDYLKLEFPEMVPVLLQKLKGDSDRG